MRAAGAALPSGQDCAARIEHDQLELRPENTQANHFVPDRVVMPVWKNFTRQANQELVQRIDGKFTGTTGEILAWGACKWGLDPELLKAVAVQESDWRQSTVSDYSNNPRNCIDGDTPPCPTSFGIMQLKHIYLPGSYPLSQESTAFNVDTSTSPQAWIQAVDPACVNASAASKAGSSHLMLHTERGR